jgi:hypothetical protein
MRDTVEIGLDRSMSADWALIPDGWEGVLKPVLARYRGKVSRIYFRADAGFANPEVYEYLETERIKYRQATAGSQRHFSLVKISLWAQSQSR